MLKYFHGVATHAIICHKEWVYLLAPRWFLNPYDKRVVGYHAWKVYILGALMPELESGAKRNSSQ